MRKQKTRLSLLGVISLQELTQSQQKYGVTITFEVRWVRKTKYSLEFT
jgi:hypothetical protein